MKTHIHHGRDLVPELLLRHRMVHLQGGHELLNVVHVLGLDELQELQILLEFLNLVLDVQPGRLAAPVHRRGFAVCPHRSRTCACRIITCCWNARRRRECGAQLEQMGALKWQIYIFRSMKKKLEKSNFVKI